PPLEDARPVQTRMPNLVEPELLGLRFGLIITEEDCGPETLDLPHPVSILALSGVTQRSLRPLGAVAERFGPAAVDDAALRAGAHFNSAVVTVTDPDWTQALRAWSGDDSLEACVTPKLTLGPVQKRLQRACKEAGLDLIELPRRYDQAVWPHAKRGFFGLKKKIPSILKELGL
ncbi:MAG: hypothetical protein AAFY81_09915, partial [Pseudomonadota bacterium]